MSQSEVHSTIAPPSDKKTEALRVGAEECVYHRYRLSVLTGPDQGSICDSQGTELSVGKASSNELTLSDSSVSRHHCVIRVTENGFHLRDLGSTNGTYVGNLRIDSAYLETGAMISVGETRLKFEILRDEVREKLSNQNAFGSLVGKSSAIRRVFSILEKVAQSDSTVLLEGPTGTGKSLVAESVHAVSKRGDKPFVIVDCGAIPVALMESELFGHERGAFTGAVGARQGAFEAAHGGTVFIDEIGELPLDAQPKLLRVLEKRTVTRVGSSRAVPIDVRVIAATNRDLRKEVNQGSFRADLFYRLNVLHVRMPSLEERPEDIPLLARQFYKQFLGDHAEPPHELVARLLRQSWPGNVRELRSEVEKNVLLGQPNLEEKESELSYRAAKARAMASWESRYVVDLINRFDNNLSRAARSVHMDRNHLRSLWVKYGTPPDE